MSAIDNRHGVRVRDRVESLEGGALYWWEVEANGVYREVGGLGRTRCAAEFSGTVTVNGQTIQARDLPHHT